MKDQTPKQRMLAIVGRPNVGKSAIFNRIAGGRVAIVHDEPGVTRDRLVREVTWGDARLRIVDTGGVSNVDGETRAGVIEQGVQRQVEAALADAAVALLVVDVESGLTPLDEAVAGWLHASGCQTLVAVNKADNPARDLDSAEFDRLGWPVFPVSALHNRGFDALMDAAVPLLPPETETQTGEALRVAIVGRPNVGKSSFINRLLNDERVIVSDVPGTTRDCVDVPYTVGSGPTARNYLLVDTAGMRRSGKIDTAVERFSRMRTEASIERAHVVVLLIDASVGPTEQDKKIGAMIAEHHRGAVMLVNKWDLAEGPPAAYVKAIRDELSFMAHCPMVCVSSRTGFNIRACLDAIDLVAQQVRMRLPTGILNRALLDAVDRVHPPAVQGKLLKIYYATQTGEDPIRIRIFSNRATGIPSGYRGYLIGFLREKFGLEGAPILLHFQERRRDP